MLCGLARRCGFTGVGLDSSIGCDNGGVARGVGGEGGTIMDERGELGGGENGTASDGDGLWYRRVREDDVDMLR